MAIKSSNSFLAVALAIASLSFPVYVKADTVNARCDVYPKGQDRATSSAPCSFSQRQGAVSIQPQAVINTLDNGNLSVTGMRSGSGCTVLFNPQGEIIQQGQSCRSTEVREAQTAIDSYLREQGTSDDHNDNRQPEVGTTVPQLSDLVGARAGQAENTVKQRGYQWVKSDDSGYSYWLEGKTNYCVTIKTDQGRYQSIIYAGGPVDCQN